MRGSAFEASFAGENVISDTTDQGASNAGNSRKRQGEPTSATNDRKKNKRLHCKACDRLHDTSKCWLAVESLRPPGWEPTQKAIDQLEKRLKKDKALAELIEKARALHLDEA